VSPVCGGAHFVFRSARSCPWADRLHEFKGARTPATSSTRTPSTWTLCSDCT